MRRGDVGDHCDGAQCPNRLTQKKADNEDPITPAPVTNRGDRSLTFGLGLGSHVGRYHRPQERSQSDEQDDVRGQKAKSSNEEVCTLVQQCSGRVGQCAYDDEIGVPVQYRIKDRTFTRIRTLTPSQIAVQVVEYVPHREQDPGSPQRKSQDADSGTYSAYQKASKGDSVGGDPGVRG